MDRFPSLEEFLSSRSDESALRSVVERALEAMAELKKENDTLRSERREMFFQIDTAPKEDDEAEEVVQNESDEGGGRNESKIIFASSEGLKVLNEDNHSQDVDRLADDEEGNGNKASFNSCFNCLGEHMLPDCPEPRDPKAIAANRRKFTRNNQSSVRYHMDENQRFGHIRPGSEPSKKLREALGLRHNQLPPYVYRLRELGYPPGWLREAQIRHSGLALYMGEDEVIREDADDEEGEVADQEDKVRYDVDKLIEWPGYNMPVPNAFKDEGGNHGCPRMKESQSKKWMVKEMSKRLQKGYVRAEMQDTTRTKREQRKQEAEEGAEKARESSPSSPAITTGQVMAVDEGTPIVEMYSPFERLPEQLKWAKDTTDHILFENLPDTTGKWDQMREVIKRGRKLREDTSAVTAAGTQDDDDGMEEEKEEGES